MLSSRRLLFNLFRRSFATTNQPPNQPVQSTTSQSQLLSEAQRLQGARVPVHLKPYDKTRYEIPMKSIKKNSGYAMIQIEPFPRARIMKICYNILTQVRKGIPETYTFRILLEQKTKYIMEIVDRQENPDVLQEVFGKIPIQIFTRNLADMLQVIEVIRHMKPWNLSQSQRRKIEQDFAEQVGFNPEPKYPKYQKAQRQKQNIL